MIEGPRERSAVDFICGTSERINARFFAHAEEPGVGKKCVRIDSTRFWRHYAYALTKMRTFIAFTVLTEFDIRTPSIIPNIRAGI